MPIRWNEIRQTAIRFFREWAGERREDAEARTFLYDPLTMSANRVKAHADLDRAVDPCYRKQPFTTDQQRIEFLF